MKKVTRIGIATAVALMIASLASAVTPPIFISTWGSLGAADGQFQFAQGITRAPTGELWVGDFGGARIQQFSTNGAFIMSGGDGDITQPTALSCDAAGNVFVADGVDDAVYVLGPDGIAFNAFGGTGTGNGLFRKATGVAVDQTTGDVYVTDYFNHRVQKFANDGTFIMKWGTVGSGPGQFRFPYGVAVDPTSGNVVVADMVNNRIQVFSPTGAFLFAFGSAGTGDGQFQNPGAPHVDNGGNIYVCDQSNNRIQEFSSAGTFLVKWGVPGLNDDEFNIPLGVTTDTFGHIFVADRNNSRVEKFGDPVTPTETMTWGRVKSLYR